jgi:hypothetical protein
VPYFHEPFLPAVDSDLHKQLGVGYTPPEIVRSMMARGDRVRREDQDRPGVLADVTPVLTRITAASPR